MKKTKLCPKERRELLERFLRYARVHTTSCEDVPDGQCPSTPGQFYLARMLEQDLRGIGMSDVYLSENGYVYATLPSNLPPDHAPVPAIGLM